MTVDQVACTVHPDQPAEGRCERCGRAACLACAVPVRGELVCREDALEEMGALEEVAPPPPPFPPGTRDRVAAGLLVLAVATTLVPWHRFGILTSILSAWTPEGGWWTPVACVALLAAGAAAVWRLRGGGRRAVRASALLAGAGALTTVAAVLAAPPFVSHSPAPFVALAGSGGAALLGALGLRRP
ncbi:MAG TPA: hypothetical protein VGB28_05450 [Actinomycetota bacterium]